MDTVETKLSKKLCTGCGCCENICPFGAIQMKPDREGFLMPVINYDKCVSCGKCADACIALNYSKKNGSDCDVYAVRASEEIRLKSSSGGVFTLLAEHILKEGGKVYGAAFDENMQLKHIGVEKTEDLEGLRGSKYVQSKIGFAYKQVRDDLRSGKSVLFTGTPCQVAGLYTFLGTDIEKLFTVDFICHGVPSQVILDRYLKEKFPDKKAVGIKFRNKSHGWTCTCIDIEFSDGSFYIGKLETGDAYEVLFHKNIGLRKSCSSCKFCDFPRTGDITLGDFWGIGKIKADLNDAKGTSLVFVNNARGKLLFDLIRSNASVEAVSGEKIQSMPNRLKSEYAHHLGREYFFKLIEKNTVEKAVQMAESNKHQIGLVGIYTVENFGGALTYFALYKTLCDMGYTVLMIERPASAAHKPSPLSKIYSSSPYPEYDEAKIYGSKLGMKELNKLCDIFIVGSDQLFNNFLYNQFAQWCTLDWVDDNKKKIAYAASFGHDYIWSPEDTRAEMAYFMQKFDSFSVREESGIKICSEEFGVTAQWVLDPIFLCNPMYYKELAEHSAKPIKKNYISAYILDPDAEKSQIIKAIAKICSLGYDVYTEMHYTAANLNGFDLDVNFGGTIEDRLSGIINSDMVIADSFHGICMAIIMKKNFIAISNEKRGKTRFQSILKLLKLEDRLVENYAECTERIEHLTSPIDYDSVYELLNTEKERCIKWLLSAIESTVKKPVSVYDLLMKKIDSMSLQINKLTAQNAELLRRADCLTSFAGFELLEIKAFIPYFEEILKESERYIVAVAAKDTPGMLFSQAFAEAMALAGFKVNLVNKHWYGYAGVVNGGVLIEEKCEKNVSVTVLAQIGDLSFSVVSKPLKAGNMAVIKINDHDYSVNKRGINVVVYDKTKHCVCDSVCFDTHIAAIDCYR